MPLSLMCNRKILERERNEIKNELGRNVTVSSANNIMTPLQNSQHPPFIHQHNHGLTILSNFPSHTTFKLNKTTQKSNHYSQSKSHNYNANQHKHIYKNSTFFLWSCCIFPWHPQILQNFPMGWSSPNLTKPSSQILLLQ